MLPIISSIIPRLSMDDLADAMTKLEGGTCDTDDNLSASTSIVLIIKPPPNDDCPICLLRLPSFESGILYYA